nr:hypothetical protein [Bernardetiaceae bacterium]
MKQTFTLLLGLFLSAAAHGQSPLLKSRQGSAFSRIYPLSGREAAEFVRPTPRTDWRAWLRGRAVLDSFAVDSTYRRPLPLGHYLRVDVVNDQVRYQLWSTVNTQVSFIQNGRRQSLLVTDTLGQPLGPTEVQVNGRKLAWEAIQGTYRLPRLPANDADDPAWLEVHHAGHVSLFALNRADDGYNWRQDYGIDLDDYDGLGRAGLAVVRDGVIRPAHWTYRKLRYGVRFVYYRGLRRAGLGVAHLAASATSPAYRAKGKNLYRKHYPKPVRIPVKRLQTIHPDPPGNYAFALRLPDSLRLSQRYEVQLWRGLQKYADNHFTYADYQLNETKYQARLTQTVARAGETVKVGLTGTDANRLPVLDGHVELWLLSTRGLAQ